MSDLLWYFGYGSNMSRTIFLERRLMRPLETRRGRLDGYALCFNIPVGPHERGVANLDAVEGSHTWGVLHLLTADDCGRLDNSEGVAMGLYCRLPVDVWVDGAEPVAAFTYQSKLVTAGRKPSLRYLQLLLEGARQHGLPAEYISQLQAFELAIDERAGYPQPQR